MGTLCSIWFVVEGIWRFLQETLAANPRSGFPKRISPLNAISFENPVRKEGSVSHYSSESCWIRSYCGEEWLSLPPSGPQCRTPPPKFQPRGTCTIRVCTSSDRTLQTSEEFVVVQRICRWRTVLRDVVALPEFRETIVPLGEYRLLGYSHNLPTSLYGFTFHKTVVFWWSFYLLFCQ